MSDVEDITALKSRAWSQFRDRWDEFRARRLQILEELRRQAQGDVADADLQDQSWRDCVAEFEGPKQIVFAATADDARRIAEAADGEMVEVTDPAEVEMAALEVSSDDVDRLFASISRKRKPADLKSAIEWALENAALYSLYRQQGNEGQRGVLAIQRKAPNGAALTMLEFAAKNPGSFMTQMTKILGQKDEEQEERDRVMSEDARDQFAVIELLEAEFASKV